MTKDEIKSIENYLQKLFKQKAIQLKPRPKADDSVEVYIGEEFIGVVYQDADDDAEDDEKTYQFQMAILEMDLEQAQP